MDKSCASSYVYAKASGMLKNTFVGKNAYPLFSAKSLSEVWELVFKTPVPAIPETLLATKLEKDAVQKFVDQFISLVKCYDNPSDFYISMLQRYDLENLKAIISALCIGEINRPHVVRLGSFELLDYTKWPDLKQITAPSRYNWVDTVPELKKMQRLSYTLDIQEFHVFWQSLQKASCDIRNELIGFFKDYYSLENLVWGLRLKVYYNMTNSEIKENLIYVTSSPSHSDPLCSVVLSALDKPLDSWEDWKDFKYKKLLNPHEDNSVWKIDPLYLERQIRLRETEKAFQMFHKYPLTEIPLAMFFILKQQELNCIRAAVERLRLGADINDSFSAAGIQNI